MEDPQANITKIERLGRDDVKYVEDRAICFTDAQVLYGCDIVNTLPRPSDLKLPIPCPKEYFDNYHHPLFPRIMPAVHTWHDPVNNPTGFPVPLGPIQPKHYNILGARLHEYQYVNEHPEKLFVKYMLWYLEVNDLLLSLICPSDLNEMPCEWDELQGGCTMLRLCSMKHKYPSPHLGRLPDCDAEQLHYCKYIHDISPSCRGITKQLCLPLEQRFRTYQRCKIVADGGLCCWGHDLESARIAAVYRYWEHRTRARQLGSIGYIQWDVCGQRLGWKPITPTELRTDRGNNIVESFA